ncbi:hydrolase [Neptunomonas sp. XY-337]|uniref:hydrolase n=1 Tax=Neptunomonas sp. XY-337 TaxID=2561897 RepID=UPI0010A996EA|nr:hydrolase [Neptunomonas sp. XY-337]
MLIQPDRSSLLIIDIQAKLAPAIHDADRLIKDCRWLVEIAQKLDIPTLATEQYPAGIGSTVPELAELISAEQMVEKIYFSSVADPDAGQVLEAQCKEQVVVIGTESHVCVLQTAVQLNEQGKGVFIVADCVGSRSPADRQLALDRMRQLGIHVVSKEMVVFEWLQKAGTDQFREISKNYLR